MGPTPSSYFLLSLLLCGCDREAKPGVELDDWTRVERGTLTVALEADNGTNSPIPGGFVVLEPGGRDATTGDDGIALFAQLDDNAYDILVTAPGYLPAETSINLAGTATVTVGLTPYDATASTVRGVALDVVGQPVEGASVAIDGVVVATTAADGSYVAYNVAAGDHSVSLDGPGGVYTPWFSPVISVEAGEGALVSARLPGTAPADAEYTGSAACGICHTAEESDFASSAHSVAGRTPADAALALPALDASFQGGDVVPLPGSATLILRGSGPGSWTVQIDDAFGATTGELPISRVYGGNNAGAALAADMGGTQVLVPAAWALDGQGLSSKQAAEGWVVAWLDGWFDQGNALDLVGGIPGSDASFDLQCGGCHATGHGLDEVGNAYNLVAVGAAALERTVGCEACHGPGSRHEEEDATGMILNPAQLPAWQRIEVCARCHERVLDDTHPFNAVVPWPVDAQGDALREHAMVSDEATPTPTPWLAVDASRLPHDQVGDFALSPHRRGPGSYDGACEDCHNPHTGELHTVAHDNQLCTICHSDSFPDTLAEAEHAGHLNFAPGPWSPGACVSCHMPRSATVVQPDQVSGAGEVRSHTLSPWRPDAALAEFDAAGLDTLPLGSVPVGACVDCHTQVDEAARDAGVGLCACPSGDPTRRITWQNMQLAWDYLFEVGP